jgi:hypothetical protein
MVGVLRKRANVIRCSDLVDYGWGHWVGSFLEEQFPWNGDIVTNPPYSIADEFVRHALTLAQRGSQVAMLLRNEWDCASGRNDLFRENPHFAMKIVLTRRPRWIAGSKGSPRHNYAWFVWEIGQTASPTVIYDQ